jgi:hypothetical protein
VWADPGFVTLSIRSICWLNFILDTSFELGSFEPDFYQGNVELFGFLAPSILGAI